MIFQSNPIPGKGPFIYDVSIFFGHFGPPPHRNEQNKKNILLGYFMIWTIYLIFSLIQSIILY